MPQTVPEGESIRYLAEEKASDPKVVGLIANMYPHRSLEELGECVSGRESVETEVEARRLKELLDAFLWAQDEAGYLFTVECHEGSCDPAADFAARQYVIASTPKETYFLILPSDVQYDPNNAAVAREYLNMSQQIGEVQVLLTDWLGE